jgi:hypothetical protein
MSDSPCLKGLDLTFVIQRPCICHLTLIVYIFHQHTPQEHMHILVQNEVVFSLDAYDSIDDSILYKASTW